VQFALLRKLIVLDIELAYQKVVQGDEADKRGKNTFSILMLRKGKGVSVAQLLWGVVSVGIVYLRY